MNRWLLVVGLALGMHASVLAKERVSIPASDGTEVYGEYYPAEGEARGAVLLMHQFSGNTCEYGDYPQTLGKRGYAVLAVDLRIGGNSFDCTRRTNSKVIADILDVPLDIQAASQWLREKTRLPRVVLVGSSYSGGLALMYAGQHPDEVAGAAAFSPASVDQGVTLDIIEASRQVRAPVLVVAPQTESGFPSQLLALMPSEHKSLVVPEVGVHGAVGLVKTETAPEYRRALEEFLDSLGQGR